MAGALDAQVGLALETTYGTAVTPARFFEWDQGNSDHSWDPKVVAGSGMQVGDGGFTRADRSVSVIGQGSGKVGLDYQTKGMGQLLNMLFGGAQSTLVSGTTYQQLFTSGLAGSLLPSCTLQYGIVRSDAAGTVDPYTYRGCTFDSCQISCDAEDVMKMEANWDALGQSTATALATATYPASLLTPFHYGQLAATIGGTIVLPTTNTLASGGTATGDVKSFSWSLDNQADKDRWVLGGSRNQPRIGQRTSQLSISTEYNGQSFDAAQVAHTTLPVVITATSDQPLSTGFATWQLVLPACKITSTNRPNPSTETPTVDYELEVRKPATGAAIYLVHRTADTAL